MGITHRLLPVILAIAAPMLIIKCVPNDPSHAGTGTETENVAGVLYNADGSRAANAKVFFVPADYNPRTGLKKALAAAAVDSTVTDDTGGYAIDSLPTGTYNILANGSGDLAYQDSVVVNADSQTVVPADTLKAPGSVKGTIRLQPGDDARTVFMLFMGTNVWAAPDDSTGKFTVADLAEGQYRVRILTTLDAYLPKDTVLSVIAGKVDSLTSDIVLQYTGIPVPSGLSINYDTLKQIVTLRWNKPVTGRGVAGYNIYRKEVDSASFVVLKNGVKDTVFSDSTGVQDKTYEYRVAAVDSNGTEGVKSAIDSSTIFPAFSITDTVFKVQDKAWVYAIEMDAKGNYVVVNGTAYYPTPAKIERYSPTGTLINSWSIPGGVEESYVYNCLALDDSNTIFVVTKDNLVIRYDTSGTVLSQFSYPGAAIGISIFKDTIYIGDRTAHMVRAFSIKGDSLFTWGSQGSAAGQFGSISALKTNSANGNVFIEDGQDTHNRLQIFGKNGNYLNSFSFQGDQGTPGLHGGEIDIQNDAILVCSSSLISAFNINGNITFRYGIFNPNIPSRKAIFDKTSDNIILINTTGEVIRLSRK